jgi:kynurenine formamidase
MPLFPGNIPLSIKKIASPDNQGYGMESYNSSTHCGTHIDSQAHFLEKGETVDDIPLKNLIGSGYVIRPEITAVEISVSAIRKIWKKNYDKKIILINTGWSEKRTFSKEFQEEFPGLSTEAAKFFIEKGIRLLGIDTLGIDPFVKSDFPAHKLLLTYGCSVIEDLTNLGSLSLDVEYKIIALPIKILHGSGSMARVVAIEPDSK